MDKFGEVVNSTQELFESINDNAVLSRTKELFKDLKNYEYEGNYYLVDYEQMLYKLIQQYSTVDTSSSEKVIAEKANNCIDSIEDFIYYKVNSQAFEEGSNGLSIFYPISFSDDNADADKLNKCKDFYEQKYTGTQWQSTPIIKDNLNNYKTFLNNFNSLTNRGVHVTLDLPEGWNISNNEMEVDQTVEITLSSEDGANLDNIGIESSIPAYVSATLKSGTNNVWEIKALHETYTDFITVDLRLINNYTNTKTNFTYGDNKNVSSISIVTIM